MIKCGISHLVAFVVSLVIGHALLVLLKTYLPLAYAFFLRFGHAVAIIFKISYNQKIMAVFVIATFLSFLLGILFHKLFKLGR